MTRRELKKLLWDAADAAGAVSEAVANHTLADYVADRHLRGTVERHLEIVGEALRQAAQEKPMLYQRITGLHEIISLRHRLAHAYADTNDGMVWDIVQNDLPLLRRELDALLAG